MQIKTKAALLAAVAAATLAAFGVRDGPVLRAQDAALNPADFSTTIDNPLFPLSSLDFKRFLGEEIDPETDEAVETKLESRVLPRTEIVAGVRVLVLEERAYTDGELVEVALDYFAQHRDGSVWYFGELVDNFENGQFRDHDGQWLSGEGTNQPGIMMPAKPEVGRTYRQENAPGIAEDEATVLAIDATVTVPIGTYSGCLTTRDVNPLDPEALVETKFYCPGVGLAREEAEGEFLNLVEVTHATAPAAAPPVIAPGQPVPLIAPNAGDGLARTGGSALVWMIAVAAAAAGAGACSVALRLRRANGDG